MTKPHIVIIGGGFGGLAVAAGLKKADAQVTLIDRSNHHLFQPLLYQVATAGLSPADIAAPIRAVLKDNTNTEVLLGEVTGINPIAKQVLMNEKSISYDTLVIATGARYHYFDHPEWAAFAPGLKSIVDATRIRRKILMGFEAAEAESNPELKKAHMTFVLVGAGPTGAEMAGSIAELAQFALTSDFRHLDPRSARVVLIEAGPRVLAGFPEELSKKAEKKLKSLGVEIITNTRVQKIDESGVQLIGSKIPAKTVIWCAGVVASPAAEWLGAEKDRTGRVKVEPDLTVPRHSDIFVIGDTAALSQDGCPLPGVAPVAMQQGKYVAASILKKLKDSSAVLKPFHYTDKGNLATIGRTFAILEFGKVKLSGLLAWVVWVVVHIYYLISFRSRVSVLVQWAWAYFTYQRGARLITNDFSD